MSYKGCIASKIKSTTSSELSVLPAIFCIYKKPVFSPTTWAVGECWAQDEQHTDIVPTPPRGHPLQPGHHPGTSRLLQEADSYNFQKVQQLLLSLYPVRPERRQRQGGAVRQHQEGLQRVPRPGHQRHLPHQPLGQLDQDADDEDDRQQGAQQWRLSRRGVRLHHRAGEAGRGCGRRGLRRRGRSLIRDRYLDTGCAVIFFLIGEVFFGRTKSLCETLCKLDSLIGIFLKWSSKWYWFDMYHLLNYKASYEVLE